eukprot:4456590-Amphidinium_carterae.1
MFASEVHESAPPSCAATPLASGTPARPSKKKIRSRVQTHVPCLQASAMRWERSLLGRRHVSHRAAKLRIIVAALARRRGLAEIMSTKH